LTTGQTIAIGTDGIWEASNDAGEMFGKDRFRHVVRNNAHRPAGELVSAVLREVTAFRGTRRQEDDITLVVIKALEVLPPPG
jgi:sigma-B regulation protein RsbU (phosphoserine phosphatase)